MSETINAPGNRGVVVGRSSGYVAGGNIYLGDVHAPQEALYEELTLKEVEQDEFGRPPQAEDLAHSLAKTRLLVFAGNRLDEAMVARHIAWLLRAQLNKSGRTALVREWLQTTGIQRLEPLFDSAHSTILLLPELSPHHLGYRLDRLVNLLKVHDGFAVVTTASSPADWGLAPASDESRAWIELSWDTFYGKSFLCKVLSEELNRSTSPQGVLPEGVAVEAPFVPGITVLDVITKLQRPDAIRRFASALCDLPTPISAEKIRALIEQFSNEREAIHRWYSRLDRKDQILALGLALFNGLPDDQAFAGIELLVRAAWRPADPFLANWDYGDLSRLASYFRYVTTSSGGWIEIPSIRERDEVVRAAWDLQRRRLLATLPIVTQLIQDLAADTPPEKSAAQARGLEAKAQNQTQPNSASDKSTEPSLIWRANESSARALFGTPRRRSQLQQAVIGFLGCIARLSIDAVESCFHELAVEGSDAERQVVAQAFADWRDTGGSEDLFQLLHRWWREGCRLTYFGDVTSGWVQATRKRLAATRATVALTVGYASLYDPPNQLHRSLVELLPSLLQDQDPIVRESVLEIALPRIVSQHLVQLQTFLRNRVMNDERLIHATGFGISLAYERRPFEAAKVIRSWHELAVDRDSTGSSRVADREQILAVVAYACGYLRCRSDQDLLKPAEIFEILRSVLNSEPHPLVRRSVLIALGLQAVNNFEVAASMIAPLVAEVTLEDRSLVVAVLVRAYLSQRSELKNGDETLEIGEVTYAVWSRPRPLTSIELSLYTWVENNVFPVAQQVAVQAFAAFAATDLECQERMLAARQPSPASTPFSKYYTLAPRQRALGPLGWLSVFLAAPLDAEARSALVPLFAEVLEMQHAQLPVRNYRLLASLVADQRQESLPAQEARIRTLPHVPMLLHRLLTAPRHEVQKIAGVLRSAVDIYSWRWAIVLFALFGSVSLLRWASSALGQ